MIYNKNLKEYATLQGVSSAGDVLMRGDGSAVLSGSAAAQQYAVLEQADLGRSIHRPACVVAEGSTFYKGYLFRRKLERLCHTYITEELGRHLVFRRVENANLLGTAAAALLA